MTGILSHFLTGSLLFPLLYFCRPGFLELISSIAFHSHPKWKKKVSLSSSKLLPLLVQFCWSVSVQLDLIFTLQENDELQYIFLQPFLQDGFSSHFKSTLVTVFTGIFCRKLWCNIPNQASVCIKSFILSSWALRIMEYLPQLF